MTKQTKLQQIKLVIKGAIIICVLCIFVILGFFVKPIRTFENAKMKKWLLLSEQERITTVQKIVPNANNQDLLISCVTKIANLPDSNEMVIHDATVLCYNGIKLNAKTEEDKSKDE